jgi:hypothetical protein
MDAVPWTSGIARGWRGSGWTGEGGKGAREGQCILERHDNSFVSDESSATVVADRPD